jgi:hypothetical protein
MRSLSKEERQAIAAEVGVQPSQSGTGTRQFIWRPPPTGSGTSSDEPLVWAPGGVPVDSLHLSADEAKRIQSALR